MTNFDVIILGAGAAGLMCASRAGQRGKRVLLLEHANEVGKKILISGGGRCNFTNRDIRPDRYLSMNPHFCKSALAAYTQQDFINLVEKHKIAYHEKTLGQLFCDSSARDIVRMLLLECAAGHVELKCDQNIDEITKSDVYKIKTPTATYSSENLVLATGGLSIPKLGATGLSLRIAQQFGLPLTETRPALVPLVFSDPELSFIVRLAGISLDVTAYCENKSFRESMVFTHRGLSGPAILQISSYWREGMNISLDLLPHLASESLLIERKNLRRKAELKTVLGELLPQRLVEALCERYFSTRPIQTYSDNELRQITAKLKALNFSPTGTEGYGKAEVMLGGIDTRVLSSKTMQAKNVPGLYVIGEAVDVTGWLGGYNFQWAWSSGWAAANAL